MSALPGSAESWAAKASWALKVLQGPFPQEHRQNFKAGSHCELCPASHLTFQRMKLSTAGGEGPVKVLCS